MAQLHFEQTGRKLENITPAGNPVKEVKSNLPLHGKTGVSQGSFGSPPSREKASIQRRSTDEFDPYYDYHQQQAKQYYGEASSSSSSHPYDRHDKKRDVEEDPYLKGKHVEERRRDDEREPWDRFLESKQDKANKYAKKDYGGRSKESDDRYDGYNVDENRKIAAERALDDIGKRAQEYIDARLKDADTQKRTVSPKLAPETAAERYSDPYRQRLLDERWKKDADAFINRKVAADRSRKLRQELDDYNARAAQQEMMLQKKMQEKAEEDRKVAEQAKHIEQLLQDQKRQQEQEFKEMLRKQEEKQKKLEDQLAQMQQMMALQQQQASAVSGFPQHMLSASSTTTAYDPRARATGLQQMPYNPVAAAAGSTHQKTDIMKMVQQLQSTQELYKNSIKEVEEQREKVQQLVKIKVMYCTRYAITYK